MTRPALIALALVLLGACTTTPKELPHYPCKDKAGRYYACSDQEWVYQQITEGKK